MVDMLEESNFILENNIYKRLRQQIHVTLFCSGHQNFDDGKKFFKWPCRSRILNWKDFFHKNKTKQNKT